MAILKRISISGYKSIEKADIELRPMNVLIGANGAGKSNLISFFELIYEIRRNRLHNFSLGWGADALLFYGAKTTKRIKAVLTFDDGGRLFHWMHRLVPTPRNTLTLEEESVEGEWPSNPLGFQWGPSDQGSGLVREMDLWRGNPALGGETELAKVGMSVVQHTDKWGIFRFQDTSWNAAIRLRPPYTGDSAALHADGSNLAAVLYKLKAIGGAPYWRIRETIRQIAPWFDDFSLEPLKPNETDVVLNWREKNSDYLFGPHQLPDGALRAMALITLLLQPEEDLPPLIAIDEPELGLHPAAIGVLAGLLNAASLHSQVIIATQSVTLLEEFEAADVIVVDRDEQRLQNTFSGWRSTFTRLDPERLKDWLEDYSLGELWQKNSLGGGPF